MLLAAPERTLEALGEESGVPITVVGEVTAEGVVFLRGGRLVDDLSGWDHFSDPASEGTRGPSSERWKE